MLVRLDDAGDPRLDDYRDLRRPERRHAIERDDFLVAEGANVVRRLLTAPLRVRSLLVADNRLDAVADAIATATERGIPVLVTSRDVLSAVAGFDLHRGVVATADRPLDPGIEAVAATCAASHGTVAVLQGLNDHENLGAIARSARALGIEALVLDATCADPWYRRAVRVSMGEMLHLPVVRCQDLTATFDVLRGHGVTIAALTPRRQTPHGASVPLPEWPRPTGGVAVVLGAEGPGLPDTTFAASDVMLRIPIRDDVDSMNVGHAAAVAFAHIGRP